MSTSISPISSRAVGDATPSETGTTVARTFIVDGVVQGVGFRPFVHRVANGLGLAGAVWNDGARVLVRVSGDAAAVERLREALVHGAPPLARVESVVSLELDAAEVAGHDFVVAESTAGSTSRGMSARLTADAGLCEQCEAELMDPRNRRYRHAFISCTDCGPRWSMLEALPYDRVRTTMRTFPLCLECAREYEDPTDRRFHAESICCPSCGPTLSAYESTGRCHGDGAQAIAEAVRVLRAGGVVALHGIGGFHLAVLATSDTAVRTLRHRKHRPAKPLAVMVRTVSEAQALVELDAQSRDLLRCAERPVVIAPMRPGVGIAANVAPGLTELGIMLPGTPIQHLLLHDLGEPLVMTSGNASGEPLAASCDDAWRDLTGIADLLLMHDRPVAAPSDDTVLRREPQGTVMLRRARGWSPARVTLPVVTPVPVLGIGADLKATVALAHGQHAWLSPHLGDQSSFAVQQRTAATIRHLVELSGRVPQVIACDAHPGYASVGMLSRWMDQAATRPWPTGETPQVHHVQHHHAHVAAVMVEHDITHPVIALAFDGAGWGLDGSVWGGEVLVADLTSMKRVGALLAAPLIGGDLAAREPWRAALGWLHDQPGTASRSIVDGVPPMHVQVARQLAVRNGTLRTSSMGRLFDAAAAVLHLVERNSYEGEAAARLEALASSQPCGSGVPFPFVAASGDDDVWRLDPRGALERLALYRALGMTPSLLAAKWHDDVAATAVAAALRAADEHALPGMRPLTVVLCGGVFQNVRLLHAVRTALEARGLAVLTAHALPPNDGAIAIGQVAVASATLALTGSN